MSLYTAIASKLLFPLHEKLKKHNTVELFKELEASQWKSGDEIAEIQSRNLQQFISTIAKEVPYYRDLFAKRQIDPGSVRTAADLIKLPLLGKSEIREAGDSLKRIGASGFKQSNTGGSSGEPLIFQMGLDRVSHDVAAKWRATRWWDVDIGDLELVVWGSPQELGAQDWVRLLRDKLLRSSLLPAFAMNEENLDRFVETIRSSKPKMLFGYPSSLSLIAEHARSRGVALDDLGIKVVFVTSERLYPHQRATIEAVFSAPVANGYGGRDAGFIAHQCPHGKMHLSAEHIIVELLDPNGDPVAEGESGEVVVTHLNTADFPFLRYKTGDVASFDSEPCSCGRGLPALGEIHGRTTDFITASDGTVMHGLALIYVIREIAEVEKFKIIQQSLTHTEVLLVAHEPLDTPIFEQVKAGFQQRLGTNVNVEVRQVDEIPAEKSGKFRYVVSNL